MKFILTAGFIVIAVLAGVIYSQTKSSTNADKVREQFETNTFSSVKGHVHSANCSHTPVKPKHIHTANCSH